MLFSTSARSTTSWGIPSLVPAGQGVVVENLIGAAPVGTDSFFYRTRSGAEIDLLLLLPGQELWAVEVKRSSAPKVSRGFRVATTDVAAAEKFIVYAGTDTYPLGDGITAIPLPTLMERLIAKR